MEKKQAKTTRKAYLKPDMKVIFIDPVEIIATSGEAPNFGEGDGPIFS